MAETQDAQGTPEPPEPLSLEELLRQTPTNVAWLRNRISDLREYPELRERLTSEQIARDVGKLTKSNIDEFMRGTPLKHEAYKALIRHLWDNKWCGNDWLKENIAAHPSALFFALSSFLESGEQTIVNLRHEIAGTYSVWRASMHVRGKYLLGRMVITNDHESGAVKVVETHAYAGDPIKLVAAQHEVFDGFMVKKSRYYLVIARQSEQHKGPPRITVFYNPLYRQKQIVAMYGVVNGCYGSNDFFAAPVYVERVDEAAALQLDAKMGIVEEEDVPPDILAKLRLRFVDNVVLF